MYLKQVIATGFKSFADKTIIEFANNITGIVGPNGSGKSNVVDAVRWVLGEQSVKSLRGEGSMTDIIFSGSKTRNPASYASVELVFDNTDHYFQINYNELSVKRMVFRTGENEYYINNQKCRLKDITNLVIDNGIGRDAFNIISQGNIQDILSSKSEDRRIIFDEAAGVSKYKKRKIEAQKKLEKTNNNIARVNDITLELEQQLSPLYEQSIKAERYLDAKKELQQIEIALIKTDINQINNEYQTTKINIEKLNNEISSFLSSNSTISSNIEQEKLEYHKQSEQIRSMQKELMTITTNVERLLGEKKIISEREKYNSNDIKVHNNLLNLKENKLRLSTNINVIKNDVSNFMINKNHNLEQISVLSNNINSLEQEKIKNTRELEIYNHNLLNTKHQIKTLELSIEENSVIPNAVKMVLNNPKLQVHNVLGKLIEVNDNYAKALDVALGYNANLIVVDNEERAKEAIDYLKINKLGRATFLPLNVIKPKYIDLNLLGIIKNHKSFVGIASDLVKYNSKYENIILNNLGNIVVSKDIDGANEIAKAVNYKVKIVSLDGDLINVGGSITGGVSKNQTSIIGEKNRLEMLVREEATLNNKINSLSNNLKEIQNQINTKVEEKNALSFEMIKIDEIINQKMQLIEQYNNEIKDIEQELTSFDGDVNHLVDDILKEYYLEIDKKNELENKLNNLIVKNDLLNSKIEELEKSFKYNNSDLYQKQNNLKDLEIKLNRMDVKLDTLLNTLNEEYMMTFEKANNEYELMMEVEEARSRVYNLKNILRDLGNVNLDSIEDYKRVKTRYEFLIDQKNDLFKALNTLNDIIKEMDSIMTESFEKTFKQIQVSFSQVFKDLFGGGEASLKLTSPENILETGVDIMALPPGKKLQHISLLSGGEKALTAIALLFSILKVRPVPFCILDEVEAALDENNVLGFAKYVTKLKELTQFIVVTHKKKTMEYVDTLYGITMQETGISKLVSVKLEDVKNYIK